MLQPIDDDLSFYILIKSGDRPDQYKTRIVINKMDQVMIAIISKKLKNKRLSYTGPVKYFIEPVFSKPTCIQTITAIEGKVEFSPFDFYSIYATSYNFFHLNFQGIKISNKFGRINKENMLISFEIRAD